MKTYKSIFYLIFIIAFTSCDYMHKEVMVYFDSSFPKKNINLTRILGDEINLKSSWPDSVVNLRIYYDKNNNCIVDKNNDTVFMGKVCKFRGLYYFNEQINDSSFWIYSVKITDNLIFGFNTGDNQMFALREEVIKGNYKKSKKHINPDTSRVVLHIDKRELRNFYSSIIDKFTPDTILNSQKEEKNITTVEALNEISQVDSEELEFISKTYPNPTTDFVNIELQEKSKMTYKLTDMNGKLWLQGQFTEKTNRIDLKEKPEGIYVITLTSLKGNQKESIKIIKTK